MRRTYEYFGEPMNNAQYTVSNFPRKLFKQERDWSCAIACIRTLLSGIIKDVPTESYLIDKYKLTPGQYYTKDIKEKKLLQEYDVVYSCDFKPESIKIDTIGILISKGYYVMVESLYNYSHWFVVMGYCAVGKDNDLERHKLMIYDPYYDEVRLLRVDEFCAMWCDHIGKNAHTKEFLAVRKK